MSPSWSSADTIYAPASGPGRAGITVIRISGARAGAALQALTGRTQLPAPRTATLRRLSDPASGEPIDEALVLWFPAPGSFTGEDVVELHIHGGPAVRTALVGALGRLPGLRDAEPGEFTRRAFLNRRLDLAQVEGLADLIAAETEAQRRQALRQMEGGLSREAAAWTGRLVGIAAELEARLDFSDEDDVPAEPLAEMAGRIALMREEVSRALAGAECGERLRDGYIVVLAGAPNAGKSALLNALAQRDVALVSEVPGTTRDAIEVRCDFGGLPVVFVDTAGWRETVDPVERAGIERALSRAERADLVLWLVPVDAPRSVADGPPLPAENVLQVRTKADLLAGEAETCSDLLVSAETGFGLDRLAAAVGQRTASALGQGDALVTRERHRRELARLVDALARAEERCHMGGTELAAEDVRLGLRALGRLVGHVDVEDVLDRIFAQFCIGK